jgi:hypothetical protein
MSLKTGMNIGLGIAAGQVIFGLVQLLISVVVGMYFGN